MKTAFSTQRQSRPSRRGSAVLIILVLMTFMIVLAAANTVTLNTLRRRLKIIDHSQIQRLTGISTNSPHITGAANSPPPSP
jgi:hypothetical protein